MKIYQQSTWLITPKTNLHVGNESSSNYGLIDKAVQRDPLLGLPCINSSSLKGALNEFCCHNTDLTNVQIHEIFGSDKQGAKDQNGAVVKDKNGKVVKIESKKGLTLFFDAQILFMPEQCEGVYGYRLVSSKEVIDRFIAQSKLFGNEISEDAIIEKIRELYKVEVNPRMDNKDFRKLCNDENLPIIARNVLENGESKNLWYEQAVPSEAIFYTFIQSPAQNDTLEKKLVDEIVQIGANATIGYGYCKFIKL